MYTIGISVDKWKKRLKMPYKADNEMQYISVHRFFNSMVKQYPPCCIVPCNPFEKVFYSDIPCFSGEKLYNKIIIDGIIKLSKIIRKELSICVLSENITEQTELTLRRLVDSFRYISVSTGDIKSCNRLIDIISDETGAFLEVKNMELSDDIGVFLNGSGFKLQKYKIIFDKYGMNSLNIEKCINNIEIDVGNIPSVAENSLAISEAKEYIYSKKINFRIKELLFFKNKVNLFDI